MADNTTTNAGAGGDTFATDDIGGVKWPRVKVTFGVDGAATDVSAAAPLPVSLTSTTVTGSVAVTGPLTDTQLRASSVPVTASISNFPANQAGAADVLGTGSLTALNQAVTLTALNATSAGYIQLAGTWVGSIQLEGSLDNFATTTNLSTTQSGGAAPSTNPLTANGFYRVLGVTNHIQIRARCSAFTSGTILVTLRVSAANGIQPVISTNAAGFLATTTIDQTTPGTTNRVDVGTINGVAPAYGSGVRGATVQRVTVATDDLVPVTGTFWQATQPISGTVALSAGAAAIGSITNTSFIATQATPANLQMSATQVVGSAATRWFAQISDGTTSPAIKAASTAAATADPSIVVAMAGANSATKIGDGTNNAAIKAASTAAAATDPALTVAISPNNSVAVTQATAANLNATVAQGTAAAIGNSWYAKLSDGTTGPVAVKAASTAAAFTDIALTVDVRPGGALVTASAALADALANPTLGKLAMLSHVYNGTTWDLQRGMGGNATTGDTGAKSSNTNGATQTNVGNKGIQIVLAMGTVTGTTPTFVMKVQGSVDGGTNFYDIPGATTASLVATGVWGIMIYPGAAVTAGTTVSGSTAGASGVIPRTWRVTWTIGGTTPSFTITSISYNYIPN